MLMWRFRDSVNTNCSRGLDGLNYFFLNKNLIHVWRIYNVRFYETYALVYVQSKKKEKKMKNIV